MGHWGTCPLRLPTISFLVHGVEKNVAYNGTALTGVQIFMEFSNGENFVENLVKISKKIS